MQREGYQHRTFRKKPLRATIGAWKTVGLSGYRKQGSPAFLGGHRDEFDGGDGSF